MALPMASCRVTAGKVAGKRVRVPTRASRRRPPPATAPATGPSGRARRGDADPPARGRDEPDRWQRLRHRHGRPERHADEPEGIDQRDAQREVADRHEPDQRGEPPMHARSLEDDRCRGGTDSHDDDEGQNLHNRRRRRERGPIQAISSGCARSASPPATGSTVASDSLVPWTRTSSEAFRALAGVAVDDDRKQRLAQLIREPQRELAQALRGRPQCDRRRAEQAPMTSTSVE